jgi:predicted nucleotidyltransferase
LIVDLKDPTRSVTATLDGPVLAVLARSGKPMTVGDVFAHMPRGSEVGVRRSLGRLVEQGIVRATEMGRNRVHELNRDHIAAPVADRLAGLRLELWDRLRARLRTWNPEPVYGCVFGSAARGDGDAASDIDVLLVHQPFPGDDDSRRQPEAPSEWFLGTSAEFAAAPLTERQAARWHRQVDDLHERVRAWTGNRLQATEVSTYAWADHRRRRSALFENIARDAIEIAGAESSIAAHVPTGGG